MKKVRLIILFMFIFICMNVSAAGVKVGNDSCEAGDTNKKVSVSLEGSDLSNYTGVEFTLSIENTAYASLEFSYNASMSFKLNGNVYSITNNSGLQAGNIGNVIYSTTSNLNSSFSIVPKNVTLIKSDGSRVSGTAVGGTVTFLQKKSNDASLTSLSVDKGVLSPAFSSSILNYNLKIDPTIDSITINADTASGATKTGTGLQRINDSVKAFNIVVTAEDGVTSKTYTINLLRGDEVETEPLLKSLKINTIGCKLSPKFDPKKTKYTVSVDEDIDQLDFNYETVDPTFIVKIKGNKNFGKGKNKVKIIVSNSDETKSTTYNIIVNKKFKNTVKKQKEEKKSHKKLFIILGIILFLLIILFLVLLKLGKLPFGKKNKDKKNNNKKTKKKKDKKPKKKKKKKKSSKDKNDEPEYDDEENMQTTSYNSEDFTDEYEEELEKTKEFNFKDFK